jgi:hypothetical protein
LIMHSALPSNSRFSNHDSNRMEAGLDCLHRSTEQIFSARGCSQRGLALVAAVACVVLSGREARAAFAPRVAIVMCEDTQAHDWYAAHSSSQALVGLAGLVGAPYHTLTLEQYLAGPRPEYTSVWFAYCVYLDEERMAPLSVRLQDHLDAGGSVFLTSPLGTFSIRANGELVYHGMARFFSFLGVVDNGWYPVAGFRVHTTASTHDIAVSAGYPGSAPLTQGVASGLETLAFTSSNAPGSEVLLDVVAPDASTSYPYLVVTEPAPGARVAVVGAYGTYSGPAAPFRNEEPAGFHDNQLLPYLIHTLLWLIGPDDGPFAGLQLSHAPMTAVGRLDGDWSDDVLASDLTLDTLIELGKQTGLATVYGIVSGYAGDDEWELFRRRGPELERLGGSIGTHSHSHDFNMSELPSPAHWRIEVADSLQRIRDELTGPDHAPGAYAFINPGNTIQSRDYGKFFDAIGLYMTHGFEVTPYASGVMGFDLPSGMEPKPVVNNTPMPDFQWLYHTGWIYSVAEAASFQARLLDYYQDTVGRGVLYNQMWHDYAISDGVVPVHDPDETSMPLFEVNRDHFATSRVYMPSIDELVGKLHIAYGIDLSSTSTAQELVVTLDYTAIDPSHREHVAGMGLRVNRGSGPIQSVEVNGQPHHGFTADTVILPAVQGSKQTVSIELGAASPDSSARLTYISKPFQALSQQAGNLHVELRDPGLFTRFCVAGPRSTVVLHADSYQRSAGQELCGHLAHGSAAQGIVAQILDTGVHDIALVAAERAISAAGFQDHRLSLEVAAGDAASIVLETPEDVVEVLVDGQPGQVSVAADQLTVTLPQSSQPVLVTVLLPDSCVDGDGDGVSTCAGDCDDQDPARWSDCAGVPDPAGCGCVVAARDHRHGPPALLWLVLAAGAALAWRRRARRAR